MSSSSNALDAGLGVVDTHVHFWKRGAGGLTYDWLDSGSPHAILFEDELEQLRGRDRLPSQFASEAAASGVSHVVHVEAGASIPDPADETDWLTEEARTVGVPSYIVGQVDLLSPGVHKLLERHCQSPIFVGVRDLTNPERLGEDAYCRATLILERLNLMACLFLTLPYAQDAQALARSRPSVTFVVDHMMLPLARDDEYFGHWCRALRDVASEPNVVCKISEFTMVNHAWDLARINPWFEECLTVFGPDRCMVGTNWPMGSSHTDYGTIVSGVRQMVSGLSLDEQRCVLSDTALRLMTAHTRP